MKNLYYNISEYIEENYYLKQKQSSDHYDTYIDLNSGFKIIYKEKIDNEKLKASPRSNVSNRTTYKDP